MRDARIRLLLAAAVSAGVLAFWPLPASSGSKTYPIDAYPFRHAVALQQWRSVLERAPRLAERWQGVPCRRDGPALACAAVTAGGLERRLRPLPRVQQVAGVYAFYNRFRYQRQRAGCGRGCWATPLEFITRRAGDCNDYVVAEYFALRHLGFTDRDLRILIVRLKGYDDPFAGGHVVLHVRIANRDYVLDNRRTKLAGAEGLRAYKLVASLNAEHVEVIDNALPALPAPRPEIKRAAPLHKPTRQPGECVQGATLANWKADLPCGSQAQSFRINVQGKDEM